MRVALVTGSLNYGGGETQMVDLARQLSLRGHDVKVFVLEGGGPLGARVREYGLEVDAWDFAGFNPRRPLHTARSVVRAGRSLRRFRPDVVHAHLELAYLLAMPVSWVLRVPARISSRLVAGEADFSPKSRAVRILQHLARLTSSAVVPNARNVAEATVRTERIDPAKVHVIEYGIEMPEGSADVGAAEPQGFVVANLRPQKNHPNLLRALALLDDPPTIHLVGDGPERARIEKLIGELGLGEVVVLEGFVAGAGTRFADAQFSVLPSDNEGLPYVVLEAMSYGVPVVATAVAGVPEVITDDVDGLLVPRRDPQALADAVQRIASDAELRLRLGEAARRRAKHFSWERCAGEHLALYESLLARRRRGPSARG